MKEIRIPLEDREYRLLLRAKGKLTWKQFLMIGVENKEKRM
jgi:hypothetical protein